MTGNDKGNDRILVFIPAYNCGKQIARVLAQMDEEVLRCIAHVIVVNNRSTDGTGDAVRAFCASHPGLPLTLLRNRENYSLGGSHKVAFEYAIHAGFDWVVVLHGDDQGDIHDLLPLLRSGEYREYDCCLGARFMPGSKLTGYSKLRTFGNLVFNAIFSVLLRRPVYDLGSGLNMYRVAALRGLWWMRFPDTLLFSDHMLLAHDCYRHRVKFFPIHWREDDQMSNAKLLDISKVLLALIFKYRFRGRNYLESELRSKIVEQYESDDVGDQ